MARIEDIVFRTSSRDAICSTENGYESLIIA
jgi:hypothetical protein